MNQEMNPGKVVSLIGQKKAAKLGMDKKVNTVNIAPPQEQNLSDRQLKKMSVKDQYHATKGGFGIINKALGGRFG